MKVFLSSTAQDLVAYRKVADDTILRLSQEAVVMERFGPLGGEPVAACERKARESDVVVCIVAHRYGFVPEPGKGSITRREVEAAQAAGKDVLVWIVDDDHPWTQKKEQDLLTDPTVLADANRVQEVAAGVQGLIDFKAWLRDTFVCDTFTTADDLGRRIAVALSAYAADRPAVSTAPMRGEIRIVHALQPAPHFSGREQLVGELSAWVSELASPDRVWSLVAAGGTGKTAVVERVLRDMAPGEANVLVWSFYERPDSAAFLEECNELFLGEAQGPAGGRLERLERGLRDGRPHLIVLDGLELVQEDSGTGRVRGELSDQSLKLLLRGISAGLGRTRALVTSRFPLVDLQDWVKRGYRDTRLDDLPPEAAVAVLRGWGVKGEDAALRAAAAQVGCHALSVSVIGSYLRSFADGRIEAVAAFNLDEARGDDPRAAKLSRVLAHYAKQLPDEERDLLARLSVFPHGVTVELLGVLIDAGGAVSGVLVHAGSRLLGLLNRLKDRGLVFEYRRGKTITWTAHPFLRESFRGLLNCPDEVIFDAVAASIGAGLETRPSKYPTDGDELDRYERLIEVTRLAGREEEAFLLYRQGLGGYNNLKHLGEFERGYRILTSFSPIDPPAEFGAGFDLEVRYHLGNDLALSASKIGKLADAMSIRRLTLEWSQSLSSRDGRVTECQNWCEHAIFTGRLVESLDVASRAVTLVESHVEELSGASAMSAFGVRAITNHLLGHVGAARRDFSEAEGKFTFKLQSLWGAWCARHHVDLGEFDAAQGMIDHCLRLASKNEWHQDIPWLHRSQAVLLIEQGADPMPSIEKIRAWTADAGDVEMIIEAHLLEARHLLVHTDLQAALGAVESGLVHANSCGFRLLEIELLVTLARIRLAWPDPPAAIQTAREALDLATAPACQYAWGEADAAQVWGEAYFANREFELANRAFSQALAVRERIEHPKVEQTRRWLARRG